SLDGWTALRDDPTVGAEAEVQVLDCLHARGDLERRAGGPGRALGGVDRCLPAGGPPLKPAPPFARRPGRPPEPRGGKADVLTALGKRPDALAAWDQAVALADGDQQVFLKLYRLAALARTSEYEQALLDLDLLAGQVRVNAAGLFQVARVYALAARTAA